jgi:hypothetical protein
VGASTKREKRQSARIFGETEGNMTEISTNLKIFKQKLSVNMGAAKAKAE